jgi:prepilin-type N-terminal cleavage/methylation domain-containing protein
MSGRVKMQRGFTLVELLVSMLLALILLASFVAMMTDTLHDAAMSANQGKLIEETGAINQFLYTELRRAGYASAGDMTIAPYNTVYLVASGGSNYCVRFGYDSNRNGEKYFGFRLNGTTLQWFASSGSTGWTCNSTNSSWQALHDSNVVQVSSFSVNFYPTSAVLPTSGVALSYTLTTLLPNLPSTETSSTLTETHYVYPRNIPTVDNTAAN